MEGKQAENRRRIGEEWQKVLESAHFLCYTHKVAKNTHVVIVAGARQKRRVP